MKTKVKLQPDIPIPVGLHKAVIGPINFARKSNGQLIMRTVEGGSYPVIEITFIVEKESFQQQFSTDPKSQWIWDNLSKALKIDNKTSSISAAEAKGKPLYIVIAADMIFNEHGNLIKDGKGFFRHRKKLRLKFYEYSDIMAPQLEGDPKHNNGIPSGQFLINEDLDIADMMYEEEAHRAFYANYVKGG